MRLIISSITAIFISMFVFVQKPVKAQEPSELAQKGKIIADQNCSRCHVVNPAKKFSGISSTPSFQILVTALDDWENRFSSFPSRLPHQSIVRFEGEEPEPNTAELRPPVILKHEDIDALVAYARTLLK